MLEEQNEEGRREEVALTIKVRGDNRGSVRW